MKRFVRGASVLLWLFIISNSNAQGENSVRPATILNRGGSVAAHLHYPPKAKAVKDQAAIPFYCEVGANGKAGYIQLFGPEDKTQFRLALVNALQDGRFQPAMSGGKAVPVMVGGTAFFIFQENQPIIAIALSTADKEKTAALGNYIQPQMLTSSAEFRRKLIKVSFDPDIHLWGRMRPRAAVVSAS